MKHVVMMALPLLLAFTFSFSHASETVKGAKKDFHNFKKEMKEKIALAEKKIEELRSKGETEIDETKRSAAKELEVTKNKLKAEVDSLKEDGKKTSKKIKNDLASSINNLNEKIQKALKE